MLASKFEGARDHALRGRANKKVANSNCSQIMFHTCGRCGLARRQGLAGSTTAAAAARALLHICCQRAAWGALPAAAAPLVHGCQPAGAQTRQALLPHPHGVQEWVPQPQTVLQPLLVPMLPVLLP